MAETERDKMERDISKPTAGDATPAQAVKEADTPEVQATNSSGATAPEGAASTEKPQAETTAATPPEKDLQTQLNEALAKSAEYLDGWQRSRAEFANYRKRVDKERDELYQTSTVDTLRKILPVIDDFDRALSNVPPDKAEDAMIKGFSQIHRKLTSLLETSGVKVVNPVGEEFNPAFHEAIGQDESTDIPSGHITVVLQKGYLHGDKVLRPAIVRVAS